MERITPDPVPFIGMRDLFFFGSNEAGIHGAGAARAAMQYGARIGQGFGLAGNTFAIPTKDWQIKVLPLSVIDSYIRRACVYLKHSHQFYERIYITKIGCGLAGYTAADIAPLWIKVMDYENVYLPEEFLYVLKN